ncbi:MAG: alcohol dehydrogenase [Aeriscardovia sp.]|nr:alcohol dehydrogenase [Aeriscardovia sp.]
MVQVARQTGQGNQVKSILAWVRIALFALFSAFLGTMIARDGSDGPFPWGLIVSLLVIFVVSLLARRDKKIAGVGVCLVFSSAMAWILALSSGMGGSILVPVASSAFTTFFSAAAGYIWLFGMIIVQLIAALLPRKWFSGKK